jgi:hypothetical protein
VTVALGWLAVLVSVAAAVPVGRLLRSRSLGADARWEKQQRAFERITRHHGGT